MNTDLASAFQTVGRLGQEPAEALKGLKAAGFDLSESQLDLIRSMEAVGDKAGAQKLAIQELLRVIGGSAAAEANTLYGGLADVQRSWDDFEKQLGRTPFLTNLAAGSFDFLARSMRKWQEIIDAPGLGAKLDTYLGRQPQWQRNADQAGASGSWGPTMAEERAAAGLKAQEDSRLYEEALAGNDRIGRWLDDQSRKRASAARDAASEAKRIADEQKRIHDKELQDAVQVYERQLDAEAEFQRESAEAWRIYNKNLIDLRNQRAQDEAEWYGISSRPFAAGFRRYCILVQNVMSCITLPFDDR